MINLFNKPYLLGILALSYLLISCNSNKGKKVSYDSIHYITSQIKKNFQIDTTIDPTHIEATKNFETQSTYTTGPEKNVWKLPKENIEITIIKSYLKNYVKNNDNLSINFLYKETQIQLIIKQNSITLLDTIFNKDNFSKDILKEADENFKNKSIIQLYRFNELHENSKTLIFYGDIGDSRYESGFEFSHFFDLNTKKLTFSLFQSEEEEGWEGEEGEVTKEVSTKKDSIKPDSI